MFGSYQELRQVRSVHQSDPRHDAPGVLPLLDVYQRYPSADAFPDEVSCGHGLPLFAFALAPDFRGIHAFDTDVSPPGQTGPHGRFDLYRVAVVNGQHAGWGLDTNCTGAGYDSRSALAAGRRRMDCITGYCRIMTGTQKAETNEGDGDNPDALPLRTSLQRSRQHWRTAEYPGTGSRVLASIIRVC